MKTYQIIARTLGALRRCEAQNNLAWIAKHRARLDELLESFPSGSGFDKGTKLDDYISTPEKLVFDTSFHHMNESGMYDGWTEHEVIVTASLEMEYFIRITGKDRNQIKEYMADVFHTCLELEQDDRSPEPATT